MSQPVSVAECVAQSRMFAAGVTRPAVCDCGAEYVQRQLSPDALAIFRHPATNAGRVAAIDRECPGGWVPLHCPGCETLALGSAARRVESFPVAVARLRRVAREAEDTRYEVAERAGMGAT
jgi:hypothetical protein